MPDILIQFHALPAELALFTHNCVNLLEVYATAATFQPFVVQELRTHEIQEVVSIGPCDRVFLTLHKPFLPAENGLIFLDKNPQAMILDIGRQTKEGLHESCLTSRITDPDVNESWQTAAKKLRAITKAGVIAVNPNTGASAPQRQHRYTQGALELSRRGVAILALGGKTQLRLGA